MLNSFRRERLLRTMLIWVMALGVGQVQADTLKDVRKKMGSRFEITVVAPDAQQAQVAIDSAYAEIDRLEAMISSWDPASETSQINRQAGEGMVSVSKDLFFLIVRAGKLHQLSGGVFDITYTPLGTLWNVRQTPARIPSHTEVEQTLAVVGFDQVQLDPAIRAVQLNKPGMALNFGGIGKGFAANRAVALLKSLGIKGGVVNAGGDLLLFGEQENGQPWPVSIADPRLRHTAMARIGLSDYAIVTSGDYEQFFTIDGERYSHIIDPRTGYPAKGCQSVTILCPDAELADALATTVFILGPTDGLALINRLKHVEGLIVDYDGKHHYSSNIHLQGGAP